mmetsp:Transcript_10731/g.28928  ORF Transcript_10731/g.28928 Transcript_10731/m.28928 type:complete len:535 (+) Transcript_10731:83-1687(+)
MFVDKHASACRRLLLVSVLLRCCAASLTEIHDDEGYLCLLQGKSQRRTKVVSASKSVDARAQIGCTGDLRTSLPSNDLSSEGQNFWPNKNGNINCSGASTFQSNVDVSKGPSWSFKDETASIVSSHPCVDDDTNIYLIHRNGKLRKFSHGGQLLWTNTVNHEASQGNGQFAMSGPALMNGLIYLGTADGFVTSVNMSNGVTHWRVKAAKSAGGDAWSVTAHAGMVLVSMRGDGWPTGLPIDFGGNDVVIALDGSGGEILWRWRVPNSRMVYNFLGSVVDDPPSLLLSTSEGRPYRVRLCDGATLWEGPLPEGPPGYGASFSSGGLVVAPNGWAYVTSNVQRQDAKMGVLSAYKVETGELMWSRQQTSLTGNAPSVGTLGSTDRLSVVIGVGDSPGLPPLLSSPGGADGGAPVALYSQLVAFDAATGEPTGWQYTPQPHRKAFAEGDAFPDHICLPDTWSNGAIDGAGTYYVGHMSGNLFSIRDANGDGIIDEAAGEVSKYYGGRSYQGSPGIAPGMLAGTPCDGLHVFIENEKA